MKIKKYAGSGKLIETAAKAAPIGRVAAAFTPAGEALDFIDLARAISSGNILDAILSGTSLLLPGSYNQALKATKVLQRNKDSLTTNITIYLASYAILEIWNIEIQQKSHMNS